MEERLFKEIFLHQNKHWFFAVKKYFFDALLGDLVKRNGSLRVGDVGCGTGALFGYLRQFGQVLGLDASGLALSYASKTSLDEVKLLQAKVDQLPLKANVLDLACLSDVLYHRDVTSDDQVLKECFRVLRPGGLLILSDSAFKILQSEHDQVAHAARRFSASEIRL
ncbi:MAG: class I SAM-dependent methyltransferase, partial [Candidatus Omnitrophica bacterium]|nr:class I SAM-dependent methyltransferase [Candidatus Omnitrophota bacterium]